jgi:hypothetical protein
MEHRGRSHFTSPRSILVADNTLISCLTIGGRVYRGSNGEYSEQQGTQKTEAADPRKGLHG